VYITLDYDIQALIPNGRLIFIDCAANLSQLHGGSDGGFTTPFRPGLSEEIENLINQYGILVPWSRNGPNLPSKSDYAHATHAKPTVGSVPFAGSRRRSVGTPDKEDLDLIWELTNLATEPKGVLFLGKYMTMW